MPTNSFSPRPWERVLIVGGLLALALFACGATLWNAARLQALGGVPWAYTGATLDPRLVPTLSPTPTLIPPTATPTARPTVASTALACADDPLELVSVRPSAGTIIEIGRTPLSVSAKYCLGSRAQAQVGIGLIPWGPGVEPVFIYLSQFQSSPAAWAEQRVTPASPSGTAQVQV